jgi:hypothetical protein
MIQTQKRRESCLLSTNAAAVRVSIIIHARLLTGAAENIVAVELSFEETATALSSLSTALNRPCESAT